MLNNLQPKREFPSKPQTFLTKRYQVQDVLNINSLGAYYKVRDFHFPRIKRYLCVKELNYTGLDNKDQVLLSYAFEYESSLLAKIKQDSIPIVTDQFSIDNHAYRVSEFISGKTLEAIVKESSSPLDIKSLIGWAIEICKALDYLHNLKPRPVIFGTLKASKIIIDQSNRAFLVGFNISENLYRQKKKIPIHNEGYSPPEQKTPIMTASVDTYALGAILYFMLTKKDPQEVPIEIAEKTQIKGIAPDTPEALIAIIAKATNKEPAERYQSAAEMTKALLTIAAHENPVAITISSKSKIKSKGIDAPANDNNLASKSPLWVFQCEDEIRGSLYVKNKMVYFGSYDHFIYSVQSENGQIFWKYKTEGGIVSKPAAFENTIIVGSEDNRLYSIFNQTGKINWSYYTNGPIRSSPFIAENHVFIGSDDGFLYAINTHNGRKTWQFEAGSPIRSTPLVYNEHIFFGDEEGDFFCLNLSGTVVWRFAAKRAITSSPVMANNVVYFASMDATLYAIEIKSGWPVWRSKLNKPSISTPAVQDDFICVGATDGKMYCFKAMTGKDIWTFQAQDQITGSPAIYKNNIYFGSVDGNMYCVNRTDGTLIWKYQTSGAITGTPAISDSLLFIGSTDHKVYALPI